MNLRFDRQLNPIVGYYSLRLLVQDELSIASESQSINSAIVGDLDFLEMSAEFDEGIGLGDLRAFWIAFR